MIKKKQLGPLIFSSRIDEKSRDYTRLANTMSSKLHVCLLQTIGAEVIEPVLWSSLDSRNRSICYAYC